MEEKSLVLAQVRELISNAETGSALDVLEAFLKKDPAYKKLHREALHLSSLFNKTKKDEDRSLISFENAKLSYSQVNNSLLNLLDHIESGELDPSGLSIDESKPSKTVFGLSQGLVLGLSVALFAAMGFLVYWLLNKTDPTNSEPQGEEEVDAKTPLPFICPVKFSGQAENILVLPFYKPGGDPIQPEGLFVERLSEFSQKINLKSDIEICTGFPTNRLLDFDEVDSFGIVNNAKMLIWGRAEKDAETTVVKTRFKYLGGVDTLRFSQLKWKGEQVLATDKVLSIVTSSGELTQDIEATLMYVVGMVAQLSGNRNGANLAFQSVNPQDSTAILAKNMILADNYLALGQPAKAQAALDTLLKVHPNYWLGRNNRANIRMQNAEYLGAIEDLNVALAKKPEDPDLLIARANAYQKSQQLYPAREDFEKVARSYPERAKEVQDALKQTNSEIARLEKIIVRTKSKPASNIKKQDFIAAADASNKLGDSKSTGTLIAKGLEIAPNDANLIAIQVDNLIKDGRSEEAKKVLIAAIRNKVSRDDISRHSKEAAKLIRLMVASKELVAQ